MTQQTNPPRSGQRERTGFAKDLHGLKTNGGMSLTELRNFVSQLQGRKPSEVMGIVSGSALIRALFESTIFLGILIAVLTIVPFLMAVDKETPPSTAVAPTAANAETTPPTATAVANTAAGTAGSEGAVSAEDAQKAINVMGLGDTKTADPNKNPLDNLDNLLDDVK